MTIWAGRLIVFYGTAHTLGALFAEGAADHADTWFAGDLWGQELSDMSPAMSAYWLSLNSFGPAYVLLGLTVLWMARRDITPPAFIGWALGLWTVADALLSGFGIGQGLIIVTAAILLVLGARRPPRRTDAPERESSPYA